MFGLCCSKNQYLKTLKSFDFSEFEDFNIVNFSDNKLIFFIRVVVQVFVGCLNDGFINLAHFFSTKVIVVSCDANSFLADTTQININFILYEVFVALSSVSGWLFQNYYIHS